MLTFYYNDPKDPKIQEIDGPKEGVWVHSTKPSEEDLQELIQKFSVDEDLLRDALDPFEVSRLEQEDGQIYIFLEVPYRERSGGAGTQPILVVLGEGFVLTVAQRQLDFLEKFFSGKREFFTTQRVQAFIQFLSSLNEEYNRHLTKMAKEIRVVSGDVEGVQVEDLTRFVVFEKTVNDFLAALVPMRAILQTILSNKRLSLSEEDKEWVEDLFLGIRQLIEVSESTHKHIVNIREASSVIMSHRLNQSIRLLTIFTIVLSVPMVLGSLYGMNVSLPFADIPGAFWGIVWASLLGMGIMFAFLVKNK